MTALRFTKDHEYLRLDGDTAVVGITDYAQEQLGDIVFVELPKVGKKVTKGSAARRRREREGGERSLCARLRRSDRGERATRREAGARQRRPARRRLVREAALSEPDELAVACSTQDAYRAS